MSTASEPLVLPRHSLQRAMFLTLILALVATIVTGTGTVMQRERLAHAQGELRGTLRPAQRDVEALLRAYVDQESGQRGFLLTGDPQFLAPYEDGRSRASQLQAELTRLSASADYDKLRGVAFTAAARWQAQSVPEIAQRRAGPIDSDNMLASTRAGKRLFDDLRAQVAALSAYLSALVSAQLDRFDNAQAYADRAAVATALLLLLAIALTLASMQLLLARPLRRLVGQVVAVANGDYNHSIEPTGSREVASVAHAAEQMRAALLRYSDELGLARERLSVAAERQRLITDLQQGTVAQVSSLGISLTSLAARHPNTETDLLGLVLETDQVLYGLREAIFAVERRVRVADDGAPVSPTIG